MTEIRLNDKFRGLRVGALVESRAPEVETRPMYAARKAPDGIPSSKAHGGLQVRAILPAGTTLVASHPARRLGRAARGMYIDCAGKQE